MSSRRANRPHAFTLVELLVVIGIIAVLISILLPAMNRARAQAQVVTCSSRLRQMTAAVLMYASENKGYFMPISIDGNSANSYGRPAIFQRGGSNEPAYLNRYLARSNTKADPTKLYLCPTLESEAGYDPGNSGAYSYYSYRYNQILGGDDSNGNHRKPIPGATNWNFIPWKANQVRQSTKMALFIEGDFQNSGTSLTQGNMSFANDSSSSGKAAGQNYHTPNRQNIRHMRKSLGGTLPFAVEGLKIKQQGVTNVAFVDGSVRTISIKYDRWPWPAWEDVFIDPYNPYPQW